MVCHISNSDHGHLHLKQWLERNMKIAFANPSKNRATKEEKKKWQLQSFFRYTQTQ